MCYTPVDAGISYPGSKSKADRSLAGSASPWGFPRKGAFHREERVFRRRPSRYLWLRSLPAGENSLHTLGKWFPVDGPRFPGRGSRLQLLRLDMASYVGVSSVHGCRNSVPRLALNLLSCLSRATWSDASIPSGLEMPTGRFKIIYSSTSSPRHQTPSMSTHLQPSTTEIPPLL